MDEMISAEEAKRNQELCRKYPFLLPYQALVETDDEDFLPRTDAVSPDFDYSYTMLDFVPAGWQNLFLEMCEKDSQRICVQCGKPATRISQGWICPFCDDCIGDRASVAIE